MRLLDCAAVARGDFARYPGIHFRFDKRYSTVGQRNRLWEKVSLRQPSNVVSTVGDILFRL
jgi:hypothetical protein